MKDCLGSDIAQFGTKANVSDDKGLILKPSPWKQRPGLNNATKTPQKLA